MTVLFNDPAEFAEDALSGFVDAYSDQVRRVDGGVVRREAIRTGKVAVVVGGGSGHYPAFCGIVGEGFADGAVVGNIFTSPSTADALSVALNASSDSGVLLLTGNYAGDVMNFGLAQRQLVARGVDARYIVITDDIASAPVGQENLRRGIAGDFTVFKAAAAAAEAGYDLDGVERVTHLANAMTRTLGVAFDGCTLPGSKSPLFTVPKGQMGIGVGIHGEPGIGNADMPTAHELAQTLVSRVLSETPVVGPARAAVVLNGLGRTKYEELFVVWSSVAKLLRDAGITIVEPDVGELVTSLDMAGCSLTLMWLDDELEGFWRAPTLTPAYRKGRHFTISESSSITSAPRITSFSAVVGREAGPSKVASDRDRADAVKALNAIEAAAKAITESETYFGQLDSVAGDGDHGRGMLRGILSAREAARTAVAHGYGIGETLIRAGQAWANRAGGTSGVLWGAMLEASGKTLRDYDESWKEWDSNPLGVVCNAVGAAINVIKELGKAEVGDKTMLDALVPFHNSLLQSRALGKTPSESWRSAAAEATQAAIATSSLRPRLGRARPLAEKSLGSPDPGAVSLALILTVIADTAGCAVPSDRMKEKA